LHSSSLSPSSHTVHNRRCFNRAVVIISNPCRGFSLPPPLLGSASTVFPGLLNPPLFPVRVKIPVLTFSFFFLFIKTTSFPEFFIVLYLIARDPSFSPTLGARCVRFGFYLLRCRLLDQIVFFPSSFLFCGLRPRGSLSGPQVLPSRFCLFDPLNEHCSAEIAMRRD